MKNKIIINAQSSIRIGAEKVIYFDPFKIESVRHDADLIFITHEHSDHFSLEDIRKVQKPDTVMIAPRSMEKKLQKAGFSKILLLEPDEKTTVQDIPVETVPAYNLIKPFHPKKNGWLGYIITLEDQRIYISGDTDATPEAKAVSCDIALIPIGGTFTMNPSKAADYINELHPKTVIPTHYGTIVGNPGDGETFRQLIQSDIEVILKLTADHH